MESGVRLRLSACISLGLLDTKYVDPFFKGNIKNGIVGRADLPNVCLAD